MRLFSGSLCATMLVTLTAPNLQAEDTVLLKYQFPKEGKLIYKEETGNNQKQKIAGMNITTTTSQTDYSEYTLKEVNKEGDYELQKENKRLIVSMEIANLGEFNYDSKKSERDKGSQLAQSLLPVYEALSGAYTQITLSPQGKVKKVSGVEELLKDILKDNPLAAQFVGGGTNKAFKSTIDSAWATLPEKPVGVGDTWDEPFSFELPGIGKLKGESNYSLEKLSKKDGDTIAEIKISVNVSVEIDVNQNGANVKGVINSTSATSTMMFNVTKGQMVSISGTTGMTGTLNVAVGGQNLQLDLEQTTKVNFAQIDKVPE